MQFFTKERSPSSPQPACYRWMEGAKPLMNMQMGIPVVKVAHYFSCSVAPVKEMCW